MKNELENYNVYVHTTEDIRGYFVISYISLHIHFIILEVKRKGDVSEDIGKGGTFRIIEDVCSKR